MKLAAIISTGNSRKLLIVDTCILTNDDLTVITLEAGLITFALGILRLGFLDAILSRVRYL